MDYPHEINFISLAQHLRAHIACLQSFVTNPLTSQHLKSILAQLEDATHPNPSTLSKQTTALTQQATTHIDPSTVSDQTTALVPWNRKWILTMPASKYHHVAVGQILTHLSFSYGPHGILAISQAITQLLPHLNKTLDQNVAHLSTPQFLTHVLVPESAILLIMEDNNSMYKAAESVWHKSAEYGCARFPDIDES